MEPPAAATDPPRIALIGAGAVGSALALRFSQAGFRVEAVLSRQAAQAQALAAQVGAPVASQRLADLPPAATLVCCCVPDEALALLAADLALLPHPWSDTLVLHLSGALTADVLQPLAARGALLLSFHPLQSFPAGSGPDRFDGITVAVEGSRDAADAGQRLARALGLSALVLSPEDKARYHLAAALASNGFVTLLALASEILASIGIDRTRGMALLRPLVEGTWQGLGHSLPEDALTGPVARGDAVTVSLHQQELADHLPHLLPVYVALAAETVRVAVRGGQLSGAEARDVLDVLHRALEPQEDRFFWDRG